MKVISYFMSIIQTAQSPIMWHVCKSSSLNGQAVIQDTKGDPFK